MRIPPRHTQTIAVGLLGCLTDLAGRWPRDLRGELGPTALDLAWQFHMWNDGANALRSAALARRCGRWGIANRGGRILWISRIAGPVATYGYLGMRQAVQGRLRKTG